MRGKSTSLLPNKDNWKGQSERVSGSKIWKKLRVQKRLDWNSHYWWIQYDPRCVGLKKNGIKLTNLKERKFQTSTLFPKMRVILPWHSKKVRQRNATKMTPLEMKPLISMSENCEIQAFLKIQSQLQKKYSNEKHQSKLILALLLKIEIKLKSMIFIKTDP